ncbi:hypothetical protein [Campylobacter concisus]|nr:hypothetical protein [Campylobacter concisus]
MITIYNNELLFRPAYSDELYIFDDPFETINDWLDAMIMGLKQECPFVLSGSSLGEFTTETSDFTIGGEQGEALTYQNVLDFCKELYDEVFKIRGKLVGLFCQSIGCTDKEEFDEIYQKFNKKLDEFKKILDKFKIPQGLDMQYGFKQSMPSYIY